MEFIAGFDQLYAYTSVNGTGSRVLRFCSTCGTAVLIDVVDPQSEGAGEDWIGVNVSQIHAKVLVCKVEIRADQAILIRR